MVSPFSSPIPVKQLGSMRWYQLRKTVLLSASILSLGSGEVLINGKYWSWIWLYLSMIPESISTFAFFPLSHVKTSPYYKCLFLCWKGFLLSCLMRLQPNLPLSTLNIKNKRLACTCMFSRRNFIICFYNIPYSLTFCNYLSCSKFIENVLKVLMLLDFYLLMEF